MHKTLVISFFIGDDHNPSGTFLSHLYIKWPNNDEYEANKETNPFTTLIINIHSPGDGEVRDRELFLPPKWFMKYIVLLISNKANFNSK